ncbi:MAG: GNAT family N-acetyltransferase [Hyphomicrobiaceae bacterium]|nr:GNAT family N-acetyltransferase [Hyphomicrobiaceae bacterium]
MGVVVRPVAAGDQDQWQKLWRLYLDFYGFRAEPAVYATTFQRLFSNDENEFRGLVAERDGRLLGLTHFLSHRHCWRVENVIYLQDLFVDASARGLGVGRRLIEAVYSFGDQNGTPAVYWLTQQSNQTAMQLYDRIAAKTDFIRYQRRTS